MIKDLRGSDLWFLILSYTIYGKLLFKFSKNKCCKMLCCIVQINILCQINLLLSHEEV